MVEIIGIKLFMMVFIHFNVYRACTDISSFAGDINLGPLNFFLNQSSYISNIILLIFSKN